MNESDLACHVIAWLQEHHWEVYQEVSLSLNGGIRADIIAKRDNIIWAIETKTSFGLQVLSQAWEWTKHAHYVSIAVPYRKHNSTYAFERELLTKYGIGLIYVRTFGNKEELVVSIKEEYRPQLKRHVNLPELHERYKSYSKAGNNKCEFFSSFKETKERLIKIVEKKGIISFKDLIDKVDHHYSMQSTAKSCIKSYIGSVIPELVLVNENNQLFVKLSNI